MGRRVLHSDDRDGRVRLEDDSYILGDGESMQIDIQFMDARRMVHDGNGHLAGERPGFLIVDNGEADRAKAAAYQQYIHDTTQRWRGPSNAPSNPPSEPPQTVAQAYAQYERDLCARWQRK